MLLKHWQQWWSKRQKDVAALACSAIFFVLFFPHVVFGDRVIIAGDALYYSYPLRTVAWNMIRAGELPLWTPHVLSGYPLLSMVQVAIAYPLTWLYLFQFGYWAEQSYVLAPFLLSPMFTYAYVRELGRSHQASLLAGLAFGYGGMMASFIANSGMLTNSLMWAPLVLLFIDRARTRPLTYCLPRAAIAYTLAVMAGHSQSYTYVAGLALAYGTFLSLLSFKDRRGSSKGISIQCRPLVVALGAVLFAAGLAAFQLFESLTVARLSVRSDLTFKLFSEGSFSLREALLSIGAPLYHYVDTSAYLAPVALLLAIIAIVRAWRENTDSTFWFWVFFAALGFVLMLGSNTPLHWLLYRVPILNQFRVPSRHTFEFTLAMSILAAYGWDFVANYFARTRQSIERVSPFELLITSILLAVSILIAVLWWRAVTLPGSPAPPHTELPEIFYWFWKLLFTTLVCALIWSSFHLSSARLREVMLCAGLMLACFVEPSATVSSWWGSQLSLPSDRMQLVSPTTQYLQEFYAPANRVYTRAELYAEEFSSSPRLEAPNLHALYGLHNVAGMEPLILDRYSRALGDVGPDSVTPRPGFPPNDDLFSARSHVLDLLNTTHVVSFANLKTFEDPLVYKDGIGLSVVDLTANLSAGQKLVLSGPKTPVDQLALVTSLSNSVAESQGTEVARVRLRDEAGALSEFSLRAGIETSEWAITRDDVRSAIKHNMAPIFDSRPADGADSFAAQRYWASLFFEPKVIAQVEIENVSENAALAVWRASLYAPDTGVSTPLSPATQSDFWKTVYDEEGVQILRNERALPRVWLVAEAEAVDGEEALRRIRGETEVEFDPRRVALLEVGTKELPTLPGGELGPESSARIVEYNANYLTIAATARHPTVLVLSEIFYPGWEATLNGAPTQILPANYLLRGVALPAGSHTIEMRYTAPPARQGAILSVITFLGLIGITVYGRHQRNNRKQG
ncbi:MAG TPA: YfhO family protein [Pyrinomonadaceae bacterium]|nr:YfhO family protein [Pyrinomonadaceae bacterium]